MWKNICVEISEFCFRNNYVKMCMLGIGLQIVEC